MAELPSFALDIGTRKVVGLITVPDRTGLKIIAAEKLEHSTRSMFDGQIHDVSQVADVVRRIVDKLQAKTGLKLTEASVAAAGRALRTYKGTALRERSGLTEITHDEQFAMELEAIQEAQAMMAAALSEQERPQDYHYVGHSVSAARLDALPIANLIGQRGNTAEIDVIATFLPRGVVDSLQAVLQLTGLEMVGLTLEPIAAISVAVPQTMRHLNLVLVDIGAGTADIAVTNKGAVTAFDMVPVAGDEITEALSEAFLLDFPTGEAVKRKIGAQPDITFKDILGQVHTLSADVLTEALRPAVDRLADQIAERILRLNSTAPQAIMLVGGGSLTPGLPVALAKAVGMPSQRVAVRGRDAVVGVQGARSLLKGPDSITPIGIAKTSRDKSTLGFHLVHVNERSVRLFHPSKLSVGDALLAAGIVIKDLQGRMGKGLTVTVDGALRIVRGTFGRPAQLWLNGERATLDTLIHHRDEISVIPGESGEAGKATVGDVLPQGYEPLQITFNGAPLTISPLVLRNGDTAALDCALADNDRVTTHRVSSLEDLLIYQGIEDVASVDMIRFTLDGENETVHRPRYQVLVNGQPCALEHLVVSGQEITAVQTEDLTVAIAAQRRLEQRNELHITVNGETVTLPVAMPTVTRNGRVGSLSDRVYEGDRIVLSNQVEAPIFAELLAHAAFSVTPPLGKTRLIMRINGNDAEFTTPLKQGDCVELSWE